MPVDAAGRSDRGVPGGAEKAVRTTPAVVSPRKPSFLWNANAYWRQDILDTSRRTSSKRYLERRSPTATSAPSGDRAYEHWRVRANLQSGRGAEFEVVGCADGASIRRLAGFVVLEETSTVCRPYHFLSPPLRFPVTAVLCLPFHCGWFAVLRRARIGIEYVRSCFIRCGIDRVRNLFVHSSGVGI